MAETNWRQRARKARRALGYASFAARTAPAWLAGPQKPQPGPLLVSGFFSDYSGLGAAVRLSAMALERAGLAPVRHDLRGVFAGSRAMARDWPTAQPGGVWLAHCNPPEALAAMARLPASAWVKRYRIGYWAWELPRAPSGWIRAGRLFHEIWTPSRFVADALSGVNAPVVVMPHPVPVRAPQSRPLDPRPLDASRPVTVLALADLLSSGARKNPLGAVRLYLRAFVSPQARVRLVVKLRNTQAAPDYAAQIDAAARGRADIHIMREELDGEAMRALIGEADVVLSPHRSEGFGLTLAEALCAGRAVLATGWSGNMDFMEGLEPACIPYTLTPVADETGVYSSKDNQWAEPDLEAGAQLLAALCANPDLRASVAAAGRKRVEALSEAWLGADAFDAAPWRSVLAQQEA